MEVVGWAFDLQYTIVNKRQLDMFSTRPYTAHATIKKDASKRPRQEHVKLAFIYNSITSSLKKHLGCYYLSSK